VRRPASGRAAFFDVDETLIRAKSMVEFWRAWSAPGGPGHGGGREERFAALFGRGLPRAEVNRAYYRLFDGVEPARLGEAGRHWYAGYRAGPDALLPAPVAALRAHRAAGDAVVLVSGSLRAVLEPLAAELGVDLVLCTEQLTGPDGRLTGAVAAPMIGPAKGEAVAAVIARLGLGAADCHAYGDDLSDLPMLTAVGHPVAVGTGTELAAEAGRRGWPVLAGVGDTPPR